jgi:hypothetical protein
MGFFECCIYIWIVKLKFEDDMNSKILNSEFRKGRN